MRRWSRQARTVAPIFFKASLLTAGLKPSRILPVLVRTPRGRKVNPRNVNDVCSYEPRRRSSLHYTVRVLFECNSSPTPPIRSPIADNTASACPRLEQCAIASSA